VHTRLRNRDPRAPLARAGEIATFDLVHVAVRTLAVVVALATLAAARPAAAIDPFEIQVYDGTANPPGVPGVELHVNGVAAGSTLARELTPNHQTHFTSSPAGLTRSGDRRLRADRALARRRVHLRGHQAPLEAGDQPRL
jgi:hypothetical protein